jgi:hypothetical protein
VSGEIQLDMVIPTQQEETKIEEKPEESLPEIVIFLPKIRKLKFKNNLFSYLNKDVD